MIKLTFMIIGSYLKKTFLRAGTFLVPAVLSLKAIF